MNTNKIATGSVNKKLLAALAVLAVAIVALAAIPAVATDSDAVDVTDVEDQSDLATLMSSTTAASGRLVEDISITDLDSAYVVKAKISLDLNGHTLKATVKNDTKLFEIGDADGVSSGSLTITDSSSDKTGKIAVTGYSVGSASAMRLFANSNLTLDGITYTTDGTPVYANGDGSKLVIKDSKVTGKSYAIGTNASAKYKDYAITIEVTGSELTTTGDGDCTVLINVEKANLTITDSKLTGNHVVLGVRSGTAKVTGTEIVKKTADTSTNYDDAVWGSGTAFPGAAVLVGSSYASDSYADASLTFTGGSIEAVEGAKAVWTYQNSSAANQVSVDVKIGSGTATKIVCGDSDVTVKGLAVTKNDFKLVSDSSASVEGTIDGLEVVSGSLTVTGDLTVAAGKTLTVDKGATLRIAEKGTVKLGSTTTSKVSVAGTVVVSEKINDTGSDKALTNLAKALGVKTTDIKTGYALTYKESEGIETFTYAESLVAAGETVVLTVVADSDSKINSVYGTYTATTEQTKRATLNSDGTYSFVMPAYATELNAKTVGALSVTYDLYLEDTNETVYYDQASGLTKDDAAKIVAPAAPVRDGYNFVGWFTDAACTIDAEFGDNTTIDLSKGSVTLYGLMQKTHAVTVTKTDGGEVSVSPASAVKDANVTLTIIPADGYDLSGLTVAGKKVTAMNDDDETKVGSKADSYTYTIKMPNNDVAVSVEFSKLYKIAVVNDKDTKDQGTITEPTDDTAKNFQFAAGTEASFAVVVKNNNAIKAIQITDTKGNTLSATEATVSYALNKDSTTEYTVTFTMPAQDVKVSATYAAARAVKLTGDDNVVLSIGKDKTSGADGKEISLAIGAKVTVTFTPKDGYGVKTLTIDGATANSASGIVWTDGVGTYTYTVPETSVSDASLKAVSGELYKITVTQAGSGNIVQPIPESAVEGAQVSFTVLTDSADVSLKTIEVTYSDSKTVTYPAADTDDSADGAAKIAYANGIATLTMPAAAVNVAFEFDDTVYYIVKVSDADHVKLYRTYTEKTGVLSDEVTDLTKVVADEYYVGITNQDGKDIKNASATRVVVTTDDTTHTTTSAVRSVTLTNYVLTASSAVYKIVIGADTTGNEDSTVSITANYTEHQSVISFEKPANGTITVTVDGKELKSGERAPYLKELVISVTADEDSEGYIPTEVKANQTPLTATNGVYAATVGMEDITISANLAQGYAINYGKASGVEISGPTGQAVGEDVVLTVTVDEENYKLTSLKITYGDNNAEVKPVTVSGATYTFEMPAGVVTVTPATTKTSEVPVAAKNVEIAIMGISNGSVSVVLHSQDAGCYIPAGKVSVTFTYANALGIDVTVTADAVAYAGTNTSAEYASVLVTLPSAVASAISSGSDVVAHATYAIDGGNSADSLIASLKEASA